MELSRRTSVRWLVSHLLRTRQLMSPLAIKTGIQDPANINSTLNYPVRPAYYAQNVLLADMTKSLMVILHNQVHDMAFLWEDNRVLRFSSDSGMPSPQDTAQSCCPTCDEPCLTSLTCSAVSTPQTFEASAKRRNN